MEKDKNYSRLLDEQIGLVGRENRYLEFKSNYQDTDKLGRYISALSNGACLERQDFAYLYFGVKDETWDVIGTTFDVSKEKAKGNQSLEIYLRQYVSPSIDFADAAYRTAGSKPPISPLFSLESEPTGKLSFPVRSPPVFYPLQRYENKR